MEADDFECSLEHCFVSVDTVKDNITYANIFRRSDVFLFGCGDCPSNKIPCRMCKADPSTCNNEGFFLNAHYCWNTSNLIDVCDFNVYTSLCYHVVDKEHKVIHQGCGAYHSQRNPWQTKYVATVSCDEYLCDSKKLYEETPFCLKRVKAGDEEKRWRRKGEDEEVKQCSVQECYIYKHKDGKYEQGCGKCNSNNKIPCRTCYTKMCNNEKFFDEGFFCWKKDEIVEECSGKKVCYYASDNKVIDQGCGDSSNIEPFAICYEKFCNTKELLDKSLFCLNKDSIKSLKQCHTECFVHRHSNGTLEQGCDNCTGKVDNEGDCYTCKEKYCNEEKQVNQHCLKNDGTTCKVPFGESCFEQRTETNEVNKGCGDCTSKERCITCNNHLCNKETKILYYCKSDEDREEICYESNCSISLKEGNKKGYNYKCGNCTENIKQKCVDCNNRPLC
ncbi:hypothetical protein ACQ4LE_005207, partial [Meloidogyne hapla]